VSDGSKYLLFWDVDTLKPLRQVEVKRQNSKKTHYINELEWWRGRILANVWFEDIILVINPETGDVEKEYGMILVSVLS
jgi:glutamine cyclotransferase